MYTSHYDVARSLLAIAFWTLQLTQTITAQCGGQTVTDRNGLADIQACSEITGDLTIGPLTPFPDTSTFEYTISLGDISSISGQLSFNDISGWDNFQIEADNLMQVNKSLIFSNITSELRLDFNSLETASSLEISNVNISEFLGVAFPLLKTESSLLVVQTNLSTLDTSHFFLGDAVNPISVTVTDNKALRSLTFDNYKADFFFRAAGNNFNMDVNIQSGLGTGQLEMIDCRSIVAPYLIRLDSAIIDNKASPGFGTLSLPALWGVQRGLKILDNGLLSNLSLPNLQATGSIELQNNSALGNIEMQNLTTVNGDILMNGTFTGLSLPKLSEADGNFNFSTTKKFNCSSLGAIKRSVGGTFHCEDEVKPPVTTDADPHNGGLSRSQTIGIGIGVSVGLAFLLSLGLSCLWYQRRRRRVLPQQEKEREEDLDSHRDLSLDGHHCSELDSRPYHELRQQPTAELPAEEQRQEFPPQHGLSELSAQTPLRAR